VRRSLGAGVWGIDVVEVAHAGDLEERLAGRTFVSTHLVRGGEAEPFPWAALGFSDDGNLGAGTGCNSMSGPYQVTGRRIVFLEWFATQAGCELEGFDIEGAEEMLQDFLDNGPTVRRLTDTELVLAGDGIELRLGNREIVLPDMPLLGTTWQLATIPLMTYFPEGGYGADGTSVAGTLTLDRGVLAGVIGCTAVRIPSRVRGDAIELVRARHRKAASCAAPDHPWQETSAADRRAPRRPCSPA
jgi:hypothetical protein